MNKDMLKVRPHLIPSLIAAAMLLLALADLPYGYYQLLRFIVCGVGVYVAYTAYNWQKKWVMWLFGFIALLFNPLIPPKGVEPAVWLKKLIEIIAHAYYLGEGVMYLLQEAIHAVYKKYGVYKGNVKKFPTFLIDYCPTKYW